MMAKLHLHASNYHPNDYIREPINYEAGDRFEILVESDNK